MTKGSVAGRTEVVVLCTLHTMHEQVAGYGFAELARLIVELEPDLVGVELSRADLANRRPQPVKVGYDAAVLPVLDREGIPAVALEPDEPERGALIEAFQRAAATRQAEDPGADAAFDAMVDTLYRDRLLPRWTDPASVNDEVTDALLAEKHERQDDVYGALHRDAWERWNRCFIDRLTEAAGGRGVRALALVGVEHGYWLRRRLADRRDLALADTVALLRGLT